jgi:hypothetical protein
MGPHQPGYLCRHDKALYGLKQDPLAWHLHRSIILTTLDLGHLQPIHIFSSSNILMLLFSCWFTWMILLWRVLRLLQDLDELLYFLGIEVQRSHDALLLS